jgi:hypothetical protein
MNQAERRLHDLLTERLGADPTADEPLSRIVLAAWAGADSLAAATRGVVALGTKPAKRRNVAARLRGRGHCLVDRLEQGLQARELPHEFVR